MIPSPFTAELARDRRSTLAARSSGRPSRRCLGRPGFTALAAVARSLRTRRVTAACGAC